MFLCLYVELSRHRGRASTMTRHRPRRIAYGLVAAVTALGTTVAAAGLSSAAAGAATNSAATNSAVTNSAAAAKTVASVTLPNPGNGYIGLFDISGA
jgi:hypothetical protein